jgi:hypothetical protein
MRPQTPPRTATDSNPDTLRGDILTPRHGDALAELALTVRRAAQREDGLLALGVAADDIASRSLDCHGTRLWAQVEAKLVTDDPGSVSLVTIGSDRGDVMTAVRGAVRAGDMIGRAPEGTLLVLLPDVNESGPVAVTTRVRLALSGMEHPPSVSSITQRSSEDPVALLSRHVAETAAQELRGRRARPRSGS